MARRTKPRDDLERYIVERDAREPGFAALGLQLELNAVSPRKPATKASRTRRAKK